jgi:threonine/homoserine/homoserine lactone efflux protein
VFLLFLALLPQFTDTTAAWPVPFQMIALGLIHTVSCGVIICWSGLAHRSFYKPAPPPLELSVASPERP